MATGVALLLALSGPARAAANPPDPVVSVGYYYSCMLNYGSAYCWGANFNKQLGDGTTTDRSVPTPVDTSGVLAGVTIRQLEAGNQHACVLSSAGAVYCWGTNSGGALGDGTTTDRPSPVAVDTSGALHGVTITQIAVGSGHTCALSSAGVVYCWGGNAQGEVGDGTTTDRHTPVAVDTSGALNGVTIAQITAGSGNVCALSTVGAVYCWGYNGYGQDGDNTIVDRHSPVAIDTTLIPGGTTISRIRGSGGGVCALSTVGAVYCWGFSSGDGSGANQHRPIAVNTAGALNGVTVTSISKGQGYHSCALSTAGAAYCWGMNAAGELGDGSTTQRNSPVAVDTSGVLSGVSLADVEAGGFHTCALSSAGAVYCWGGGPFGQLGTGAASLFSNTPVAVQLVAADPPTGVGAVAGDRTIAVSWTAPRHSGTGRGRAYRATASPGGATCTASSGTRCTIGGLTNGTTYTITVRTTTTAGDSADSDPVSATPRGLAATGSNPGRILLVGLGLLLTGTAAVAAARRRG